MTQVDERPLERERELARLAAAMEAAGSGRGVIVYVEAPAGLGKSRLLAEAGKLAAERGMTVLRGVGSELERDFPFGLALQLFEARLQSAATDERARLLAGSARLAVPLLGGKGLLPAGAAGLPANPSLLHGLYWVTANLTDRAPVALLADDAHWADPQSLRFLLYLTQRIAELPVAVVVAARGSERAAERDLLVQLAAHPGVEFLRPAPLSLGAVERLVQTWALPNEDVEPAFSQTCAEVTGGNPLLLRGLLASLAGEDIRPVAASIPRVREIGPGPVTRAMVLALRRLPPAATDVARALAVLGDGALVPHVAELAGLEPDATALAAEDLEAAGILREGPQLAYAHPILRSAVQEALSSSELSRAHRLAARIVAATAPLERVAAHLVASRPAADAWAVDVLRRAAARAREHGAPEAAARYLLRALTEPPPEDERSELLVEFGRAEAAAGNDTALDSLTRALETRGDGTRVAELLLDIGRLHYARGHFGEAADAFDRGCGEAGDDRELRLELESGYVGAALSEPAGGAAACARLAPLLEPGAEPQTKGERVVLAHLAGAEMIRGKDHARAIELALRAWGDGAFLDVATSEDPALPAMAGALTAGGAFEESLAVADAALADARRRGSMQAFATASCLRGWSNLATGRLSDAIADCELALQARRYSWETMLPAACWILSRALLERGDVDHAERVVAVNAAAGATGTPIYEAVLQARAHVALARGDAESALRLFQQVGERTTLIGARNPALVSWQSGAGLALARLGKHERALALADEEVDLARRYGADWAVGRALIARGIADPAGGLPSFEEAVALLEGTGARLELGHALVAHGAAMRRANKRAAAREPLRRALDLADRCGAHALAERARDELRAAGARPRTARLSGTAALTPSERRVADMAAAQMTNREIAESLFVTVKAVSFHLGNVYRKLGVRAREELGGALPPQ